MPGGQAGIIASSASALVMGTEGLGAAASASSMERRLSGGGMLEIAR